MHWKKFFSYRFIAAEELDGKEITLTIIGVTTDEVYSPTARAKEKKAALKFKETDKMVILNATNARKITEILGSPQVETWTGKRITLYPLAIQAFGQNIEAIRIKKATGQETVPNLKQIVHDDEPEPETVELEFNDTNELEDKS
jgi:hypothetical protein